MQEWDSLDYEHLKRYSLFGGITREAFEAIKPLIHLETFKPGDEVMREGTVNDRVHFICSGSVEVLKHMDGKPAMDRRITIMETGDTFGEMELIDVQPCAATVRARELTHTLTLSHHDLYKVAKADLKT